MSTGREKSSPFPHSSSPIFSQIEHQNTSPSEKDGICILSSRDILRLIQSMNFLYICIGTDYRVFSCFARCLRLREPRTPLTTRYDIQAKRVNPDMIWELKLFIDISSRINCYYLITIITLTKNYTDFSFSDPIEIGMSYKFLDSICLQFVTCDIRYNTEQYSSKWTFCDVFFPLRRHN